MKTSIDVDETLWREFDAAAHRTWGIRSYSRAVERLIREWLPTVSGASKKESHAQDSTQGAVEAELLEAIRLASKDKTKRDFLAHMLQKTPEELSQLISTKKRRLPRDITGS